MATIFDLLNEVRNRPSMYVGWSDRKAQLQHLESILYGYERALGAHDIDEPGVGFSRAFMDYLTETQGWDTTCGIAATLLENCSNEAQAWERFWEVVEQFRRERGEAPGRSA